MLIREKDWNHIRHLFTEEEKAELRAAVTGEVICPAGWTIDRSKVRPSLLDKLTGQETP
jgi:hypothetical protein